MPDGLHPPSPKLVKVGSPFEDRTSSDTSSSTGTGGGSGIFSQVNGCSATAEVGVEDADNVSVGVVLLMELDKVFPVEDVDAVVRSVSEPEAALVDVANEDALCCSTRKKMVGYKCVVDFTSLSFVSRTNRPTNR